jgi:hypothetical protein
MMAQAEALLAGSASSHWWNTDIEVDAVMRAVSRLPCRDWHDHAPHPVWKDARIFRDVRESGGKSG